MRYLVVDDARTMRRIVVSSLASLGFDGIVEAENGLDALEKLKTNKVDFIITDWNMPVMNGLDFIKNVKSDPLYSSIPILMVTTRGNKEDIVAALRAKVDNYVIKPFSASTLKSKIEDVMAKKQAV